jgi:hypothetical protein
VRRFALVATLLLLGATACRSASPSGPALVATGAPYRTGVTLPDTGAVFIYGVRKFHANRAVTIRTFVPLSVPAGVRLLTARASFLVAKGGHRAVGGWPGAYCTRSWPIPGYGPTYAAEWLKVDKGETVAFTVYGQVTRPGTYTLDGYVLSYDDTDPPPRTIRESSGQRLDVVGAAPGTKGVAPCPPAGADAFTRPAP